jgi:ADP-ribose pyrophosphatase YjhB (NUDIX family)
MPNSSYVRGLREHVGHRSLLLPAVTAVVFDGDGRLLLGERADDGRWGLITGVIEPGEQPAETIVREVHDQTAVHVVPERITSVFTQPPAVHPNGDACEYVDITFRCRAVGGEARANGDESLAVGWFTLDDLPPIGELVRKRVEWALEPGPWFALPALSG